MPDTISTDLLGQMLRSIASQKRTGVLKIEQWGEREVEQGKIYFERGCPVRAYAAYETGEAALRRIRTWKYLTCSFEGVSSPFPGTLAGEGRVTSSPGERQARPTQTEKLEKYKTGHLSESLAALPGSEPLPQAYSGTRYLARSFVARRDSAETSDPLPASGMARQAALPALPTTPRPAYQAKSAVTSPLEALSREKPVRGRSAVFKAKVDFAQEKYIQQMERRQRIIFILLDGSRTISDIAYLTNYTENEVEMVLIRLTEYGYTEQVFKPSYDSTLDEKMINLFSMR